jgi:hypothetical protein
MCGTMMGMRVFGLAIRVMGGKGAEQGWVNAVHGLRPGSGCGFRNVMKSDMLRLRKMLGTKA